MDTDAICKTNLYVYVMNIDTLNELRNKYSELDIALDN